MKQLWTADKLGESWTLSHDDFVLARNHLGFALQLYAKFVDGYREMAGDGTEGGRDMGLCLNPLWPFCTATRSLGQVGQRMKQH